MSIGNLSSEKLVQTTPGVVEERGNHSVLNTKLICFGRPGKVVSFSVWLQVQNYKLQTLLKWFIKQGSGLVGRYE